MFAGYHYTLNPKKPGYDGLWGTRFWGSIHALERSGRLVPEVARVLTLHGYVGAGSTGAPRAAELKAALERLAAPAVGGTGGSLVPQLAGQVPLEGADQRWD